MCCQGTLAMFYLRFTNKQMPHNKPRVGQYTGQLQYTLQKFDALWAFFENHCSAVYSALYHTTVLFFILLHSVSYYAATNFVLSVLSNLTFVCCHQRCNMIERQNSVPRKMQPSFVSQGILGEPHNHKNQWQCNWRFKEVQLSKGFLYNYLLFYLYNSWHVLEKKDNLHGYAHFSLVIHFYSDIPTKKRLLHYHIPNSCKWGRHE